MVHEESKLSKQIKSVGEPEEDQIVQLNNSRSSLQGTGMNMKQTTSRSPLNSSKDDIEFHFDKDKITGSIDQETIKKLCKKYAKDYVKKRMQTM